jgi:hypothetical protein
VQTVSRDGFTFTAPVGFTVGGAGKTLTARSGKTDLLEVMHFTLEKPYVVARFPAVSRELDRVAAGLAKQNSARVVGRSTTEVSGRKTRYYQIEYPGGTTEEIAFVLVSTDEYQVLCRRKTAAADSTCAAFFSSFALSSGAS